LDIIRFDAAHPREVDALERHGAEVVDAVKSCPGFMVDFLASAQDVYLDLGGLAVAAVEAGFVEEVNIAAGSGEQELIDAIAGDVWKVEELEGCVGR